MKIYEKIKNWSYRFLIKTQKYTGTDNVYLARGGIWLTLGQIITMAASFLLAIAFANLLDPVTYGNYKYILSLFGILGIFSLSGMRTAVAQAVARDLEGSFYAGFKAKLRWGVFGSTVAIGGGIYYWLRGNEILPIPLFISAVFLPLMYASQVYSSFLGGRKLFNVQVKYSVISQIASALIILITLFVTKNLFWLIAAYLISHTFLNYFFYVLTKIKFRPNKKEDEKTLSYGKHLSFIDVINNVASYLDKILLFTLVGSAQLAVYSFAILIPEQINSILGNINSLAFPKLALKSREEIKKNIFKKVWKLAFLAGVIVISYIIIAPYIYKLLFPQYLNSIHYSQIFILYLISLPTSLLGTVFQAKMMKKELYIVRIIPFTRIALFAILIPLYGIWGLVIAKVSAEVVSISLTLFLFRKF